MLYILFPKRHTHHHHNNNNVFLLLLQCTVPTNSSSSSSSNNTITTTTTMASSSSSSPTGNSTKKIPFFAKLEARCTAIHSLLCVGLDPHESELSSSYYLTTSSSENDDQCDAAFSFCKTLIDATKDKYAACYKPNVAFFEALPGDQGMTVLKRVLLEIPPDIPVLLDVKRGDIGSTAEAYAKACYCNLPNVDAVTLSPLMGWDSVAPFVTGQYSHKGAFVLCKTSNPGSNDLMTLPLSTNGTTNTSTTTATDDSTEKQSESLLYERIATLSQEWSTEHQLTSPLGLVVGATDAEALSKARRAAPRAWILAPGVGAQGGDLEAALSAGLILDESSSSSGGGGSATAGGMLIPVSRGISRAEHPGQAAKELVDAINAVRDKLQKAAAAAVADGGGGVDNTDALSSSSSEDILPYQKQFLEFSLHEGVLKFGSFTLKSGRTSPYFFNAGLFATGKALHQLGNAYAAAIMASPQLVDASSTGGTVQPKFDVLFGPAYKGIPLGAVVSAALYRNYGINVGYAYNRKEAKDHGEGGMLVGASLLNKRVLVVDDVITAGTAIRESYDLLQGSSSTMVGVVIALDRAEKRSLDDPVSAVQAVQRDLGVPVISIVNLPQLQTFLETSSTSTTTNSYGGADTLQSVKEYRAEYGV